MYVAPFEVKLVLRKDRYGRSGDHISFDELGFPGIRFTEPRENYAHQHEDPREEGGRLRRPLGILGFRILGKRRAPERRARRRTRERAAGAARHADRRRASPRYARRVAGRVAPARGRIDRWVRGGGARHGGAALGARARGRARRETTIPEVLDDVVIGLRAVGSGGHRSFATVPRSRDPPRERPRVAVADRSARLWGAPAAARAEPHARSRDCVSSAPFSMPTPPKSAAMRALLAALGSLAAVGSLALCGCVGKGSEVGPQLPDPPEQTAAGSSSIPKEIRSATRRSRWAPTRASPTRAGDSDSQRTRRETWC